MAKKKHHTPDQIIHLAPTTVPGTGASTAGNTPPAGACPAPGSTKPQLEPEALQTIHADSDDPSAPTARSLGFTGKGVTVAFIADGLDIDNQDFIRADGSHVFVDYKDFSGEGTGVPTGGELAYLDTNGALPGFVELIETSPGMERAFGNFYGAREEANIGERLPDQLREHGADAVIVGIGA